MKSIALAILILLPLLPACVGGSLRDHPDLETLPLREATKEESKRLKVCLRAVHHVMAKRKTKLGSYYSRAADLPTKKYCHEIKITLDSQDDSYEANAVLADEDSAVKWTINQDELMEELSDPPMDEDFEF